MSMVVHESQCSTVVRNTVVRATIKVSGKHLTLGTRRAQTLWPIDLKFDVGDYVGGMTPHAKNSENRPRRAAPAYGWNIMFKCFFYLILHFFCWLLAQVWRTHFWECRHRFCVKRRGSVRIDFLGGHNFNTKIFPHINPQKPQILDPFLDLENFQPKRFIMGRLISKLPLTVTAAPWKLQSE